LKIKFFNPPIVNHSLKYNPLLDGIRGIAILAVLLFHIWPAYFPFGYLGVDIFFILSGYLITKIIYNKLKKGSFCFKEFYRNRIRRIFPATIIVLSLTLLTGYLFLFPSELENLGKHIEASAFFYQNFNLMHEVGYWDKAAELKPLLHFWSLSIEEQFYILWPLLIYLIYKYKIDIFKGILSLFFIFLISHFIINNFYHPLSRFWELSLGGLLFAIEDRFHYNLPRTNILFSNKLLVFLGLISFPLYLIHYVVISYMHIFDMDVQKYGLEIIIFSIVFSYFVYKYIEFYARRQKSYMFAFFLFVCLLSVGFMGKYIYHKNGLPNRSFLHKNIYYKQFIRPPAKNSYGVALATKLLSKKPINNYIKATSKDINSKYLLIVGDSHAETSYIGFAKVAKKHGYETFLIANSSCPPYINAAMGSDMKDLKQCKEKIDNIYKIINSDLDIKKIIFVTRGTVYMKDKGYGMVENGGRELNYHFIEFFKNKKDYNQTKEFLQKVENTFSYFNHRKTPFYYLMEDPELGFDPKNCVKRPFVFSHIKCKVPLKSFLSRQKTYRTYIYKLSKKYKNINILDPKDFYCDDKFCYAVKDGHMLYADDDHYSVDGAIMQANYFEQKIFDGKR